jgi:phosphopantothenoylcysteine synthetase/decarboxylase
MSPTVSTEREIPPLLCRSLVLCVCGGIGAADIGGFIVRLRQYFVREVVVAMTAAARNMVTETHLGACSGVPPITSVFSTTDVGCVPHIQLAQRADVILVMPATANILAKAAHGIADDIVSTIVIAAQVPVVFVPSMNDIMWNKVVVQENVAKLIRVGCHVVPPGEGVEVATLQRSQCSMPHFDVVLGTLFKILHSNEVSEPLPSELPQI